jgi:seryl-tRNA synthetase
MEVGEDQKIKERTRKFIEE